MSWDSGGILRNFVDSSGWILRNFVDSGGKILLNSQNPSDFYVKEKTMTLIEIYHFLDSISPFETQEAWDNSGILVGKKNSEIKEIFASLEVTKEIAESTPNNALLIAHHPLIFKPLKNLCADFYPNNILEILLRKNIALIAMHTNFDLSHLNVDFVKNILGFEEFQQSGFVIKVPFGGDFTQLLKIIKQKLPDSTPKITKASDFIENLIIVCGAGCGAIGDEMLSKNSCIITGDVKYHDAMKFLSLGVSAIDVGHFHSEGHFGAILQKNLLKIGYKCIIPPLQNPIN